MQQEESEVVDSPPDVMESSSSVLTDIVREKIVSYYTTKFLAKEAFFDYLKNLYVSREHDFLR